MKVVSSGLTPTRRYWSSPIYNPVYSRQRGFLSLPFAAVNLS